MKNNLCFINLNVSDTIEQHYYEQLRAGQMCSLKPGVSMKCKNACFSEAM